MFVVDKISKMFITGPEVIKTVTHEEVSKENLGGATAHGSKSGVSHFTCNNEIEVIEGIKTLLGCPILLILYYPARFSRLVDRIRARRSYRPEPGMPTPSSTKLRPPGV